MRQCNAGVRRSVLGVGTDLAGVRCSVLGILNDLHPLTLLH